LKQRCKERGISLHRLALLCDLNQIYFYQVVSKNKKPPPPEILRLVSPHLDVPLVELMLKAGHLTEQDLQEYEKARRPRG
jgi:transcriptional regulator with XRE-family HTH domain